MTKKLRLAAAKQCLELARDLVAEEDGEEDTAFVQRVHSLKTNLNKLGPKKRKKLNQYDIGTLRPNSTVEDLVGAIEKILAD